MNNSTVNRVFKILSDVEQSIKSNYPEGLELVAYDPARQGNLEKGMEEFTRYLLNHQKLTYTVLATRDCIKSSRSIEDLYAIILHYFPKTTFPEFFCFIFSLIKKGEYDWMVCGDINRVIVARPATLRIYDKVGYRGYRNRRMLMDELYQEVDFLEKLYEYMGSEKPAEKVTVNKEEDGYNYVAGYDYPLCM